MTTPGCSAETGRPYVKCGDGGLWLHCHLQPGASRDEISGIHGERLKLRINAPPVDGKANEQLIRFMAKALGVAKGSISLVSGHSSRQKTLFVADIDSLPSEFPRL
ncbi:MAG: DUF167 family protein [Porticoccaceae bacterium]